MRATKGRSTALTQRQFCKPPDIILARSAGVAGPVCNHFVITPCFLGTENAKRQVRNRE